MVYFAYIPAWPSTFYFSCLPGPHRAKVLNSTNHSPSTPFMQMEAPRADRHMSMGMHVHGYAWVRSTHAHNLFL